MSVLSQLKEQILRALPALDMVIGWESGFDSLHHTPLFIREPEDVNRLDMGFFAVHNLAVYLPGLKTKRVGVLVKGCDSRAVNQLLLEGLIKRENVTVFGFPCQGVVDLTKIRRQVDEPGLIKAVTVEGQTLVIELNAAQEQLPLQEVLADKCLRCRYPNALLYDHFAGKPREPHAKSDEYSDVTEFEAHPLEERFAFWQREMNRCIRCYACRNACPLCVCRDYCVAQSRDPHWVTQEDDVREKWMFQIIHAMHLAGRCVDCGECQRACPVDIPLLLLKRKLNRETWELFGHEAGVDPQAVPPLLTFQVEEKNINERGW